MIRKVLVTGGCGFIGSVVSKKLLEKGYNVSVIDNLIWKNEVPVEFIGKRNFQFMKGDIRNDVDIVTALKGMDAVIHLAAIVGDPACRKMQNVAREINSDASIRLFDRAKKQGIKRFIFASTCSNYGKMDNPESYVDETSVLSPVSIYAETKVKVEKYILNQSHDEKFIPVVLRFATAYGLSFRPRFDLTVNEFTKELALERELEVFGKQFWRPYCHVEDIANACVYALEADKSKVSGAVFNVGDTSENYQKQMIVEVIKEVLPNARVRYIEKDEDPRDYKVDFSRIKSVLSFSITKTVPDGIKEILAAIRGNLFSDPDSRLYRND